MVEVCTGLITNPRDFRRRLLKLVDVKSRDLQVRANQVADISKQRAWNNRIILNRIPSAAKYYFGSKLFTKWAFN